MKIKLLEPRLIGDKMEDRDAEIDLKDEGYAEYLIKTGIAKSLEKVDKLDEAIGKNDPNIIRQNQSQTDEPVKRGKR